MLQVAKTETNKNLNRFLKSLEKAKEGLPSKGTNLTETFK